MAKNEVFKVGAYLSLPVPTGAKAGSPVLIGDATKGGINAVLHTDEGSVTAADVFAASTGNEPGNASVALWGVWKLAIEGTATGAVGNTVYIGTATGEENKLYVATGTGRQVFGKLVSAKGATAGQVALVLITN